MTIPLALLGTIDPVLRDSLAWNAVVDRAGVAALRYDFGRGAQAGWLRRLITDGSEVLDDSWIELRQRCASCVMHDDAITTLEWLLAQQRWNAILWGLPVGVGTLPACLAIEHAQAQGSALAGAHLAGVAVALDLATATEDIVGEETLVERGIAITAGDERSVGEVLAAQIGHADLVITTGWDDVGSDLVEHLRPFDGLRCDGLHEEGHLLMMDLQHSCAAGKDRLDPAFVEPWGGPADHGVWTLDLTSDRPFHPDRLLANIEQIGSGRLRSRGRFWVPHRAEQLCGWDGAGGQISIGQLRRWHGPPSTRLVVTGVEGDQRRVADAFGDALLTESEWNGGLVKWVGRSTALDAWLD